MLMVLCMINGNMYCFSEKVDFSGFCKLTKPLGYITPSAVHCINKRQYGGVIGLTHFDTLGA